MLEILLDSGETILLGHLSSTYVHEGQRVKKGHVVGRQGSTGKSTGEHVHMGVTMADGSSKNPFVWFMENANE
jgi:murein DD-endopeptidase MepM/ murein hydrolase activator NlpD